MGNINGDGAFPPWSRITALSEMTMEAGIDFDDFIAALQKGHTVEEMGNEFQVSQATLECLSDHFYRYGIGSVMGGD